MWNKIVLNYTLRAKYEYYLKNAICHFGTGGSFGYNAFFRGNAPNETISNVNRQILNVETDWTNIEKEDYKNLEFLTVSMPENISFYRTQKSHIQRCFSNPKVSIYHHHISKSPEASKLLISSPYASIRNSTVNIFESCNQQYTRGVATQLILEGRGVKAYFDPEWPDLLVRLGVGAKPLALRRLAEAYGSTAKVYLDRGGTLMTIHGYDKRAVGTLTMAIYKLLKANPYTLKGAHVAFYPIPKKISSKK